MTELQRELMLDDIRAQLNYLKSITPTSTESKQLIEDKINELTLKIRNYGNEGC